jgi:hypothetical protein
MDAMSSRVPPPLLAALIAGCAPAAPPATAAPQGREVECDAAPALPLIGRIATPEVQREALALAGAEMLRLLRPGDSATADYQTGRLNIIVDDTNKIMDLRCG